jgi:hypothetical protein
MQVFGLPSHLIRTGKLASRIAAKSSNNEAAIRRATVARWRQAMDDGLTADQAAQAVGVPRASLYRWQKRPELRSRRPKRVRAKTWTPWARKKRRALNRKRRQERRFSSGRISE